MARGVPVSPELGRTVHRMREDGMILTEISRFVGLSISRISRLLRNTNPESGKKMDVRKRGRKPVDGLDNLLLLEVMMNYDPTEINRTGGQMFSKNKLIGNLQELCSRVFIMARGVSVSPELARTVHRMRKDEKGY